MIAWNYDVAFSRNRGLISDQEQALLRRSRVAIAGLGGVGGIHAVTLARLGVGQFSIADPDRFDVANFNRQYGATIGTVGIEKCRTMEEIIRSINPEANIRSWASRVTAENVGEFLDGADVFLDGVDAFEFFARRRIFKEAARRGIPAVTAGPIGFSTAWLVFDPKGMAFDDYFDVDDDTDPADAFAAFVAGLVPSATHRPYMDFGRVDLNAQTGPSASLACQLAAGVASAEIVKILLKRGERKPAPWFHQFDAYRLRYKQGYLVWGNRGPLQRLKRWRIKRGLESRPDYESKTEICSR